MAQIAVNPGRVICERRNWRPTEQFRLRCQYDARSVPPGQGGTRETLRLTDRAARQLSDAVEWAHADRRPFTTFLTLTFDADARARIDAGETTIQAELGRFFDAVNVARKRGFRADPVELTAERHKFCPLDVDQHGRPGRVPRARRIRFDAVGTSLRYLWVAENPKNRKGERNPHVHLLIRWRVDPARFQAWAAHLEKLWGQGFAKLEKIRSPREAADYLLKAVGYLSKGTADDQGPIQGNRYGIAQCARPPAWEHEWTRELGLMPRMMRHAARWQRATMAPKRRERARLAAERAATPKAAEKHRAALARRIGKLRNELRDRPLIAGKHVIRTVGREQLRAFLAWAEGRKGPNQGTELLPRRRPAKPYAGGPRPAGLGVQLAREVREGIELRRHAPRLTVTPEDVHRWADLPEAHAAPIPPPSKDRIEWNQRRRVLETAAGELPVRRPSLEQALCANPPLAASSLESWLRP